MAGAIRTLRSAPVILTPRLAAITAGSPLRGRAAGINFADQLPDRLSVAIVAFGLAPHGREGRLNENVLPATLSACATGRRTDGHLSPV